MKIEIDKGGVVKADGKAIGTIEASARKTLNFQGEETNLEVTLMIEGRAIVINSPIAPAVAESKAIKAE
jgi:hypothetical protein